MKNKPIQWLYNVQHRLTPEHSNNNSTGKQQQQQTATPAATESVQLTVSVSGYAVTGAVPTIGTQLLAHSVKALLSHGVHTGRPVIGGEEEVCFQWL